MCSSLKKLMVVYMVMKQAVPAHCSNSSNFILSIYLDIVNLACVEDEVHVDVAVVDPNALVTFSHGIVSNSRMVLTHVLFH
jgi:hypothetical protein